MFTYTMRVAPHEEVFLCQMAEQVVHAHVLQSVPFGLAVLEELDDDQHYDD